MSDVDGLLERLNGLRETRTDDAIDIFEKRASLANVLPQIIATIEQQRAEIERLKGPKLARVQPCGCRICVCEDPVSCHGCGAKNCGTHPPGEIPNMEYEPC